MFKQFDNVELTKEYKGGVDLGIKPGLVYPKGSKGVIVQMYGDMAMVEIVEPIVANKMVTVRIADLKLVEVHF